MKNILHEKKIKTDVLIVGAGVGGMMAAISAADCGAHVTLCEMGNARRSGGLWGGNDHFYCYIPEIHGLSLKEKFIKEILDASIITDEDLVRRRIDLQYEVLKRWESWGINVKTNGHYEFVGHGWPGSSGKMGEPGKTDRPWIHFSDHDLCPKLEEQLRKRDVHIINRVMVTELLKDTRGRVVGAVGISTREPELLTFQAKSIVINKGGVHATRIYPAPYLIGYGMAQPGAGAGVMMAYKAGADVRNAELCTRQVSLRFGPFAGKGTWIGVTRNAEGKPIAPPYLSEPDGEIGDPAVENADAFDHAWATGKGPVWMDPRGISEEEERYMKWGFDSEALTHFLKWLDREKIDVKKTRFEFAPIQPGTLIEARVDANFRTTLQGLIMLSTRFLDGSATGGQIAGESAAKDAQSTETIEMGKNRDRILEVKNWYEELLNRDGPQFVDWRECQWAVWQTMHCYALPPRRTESTLLAGYNRLLRIRERAYQILGASNQHDLYHCVEVLNLMDIAELVLLAVNERKESRGQARRQDYPFVNPMLNKFLVISQEDGRPNFRWEKPRRMD